MNDLHNLLDRQIRKTLDRDVNDLSSELKELLHRVNRSYHDFEDDRKMLERSLELTSDELVETNRELRQTLKEVEHEAKYDSITGLPNRNFFNEKLEEILEECGDSERVGILFMDVDGFKKLNDAYGHPFGDKVLERLGTVLNEHTTDDDFLSRWGGDEFVVLVRETPESEDIEDRLESIRDLFDEPFEFQKQTCFLKASIGVAIYPEDDRNPDALLSKADMAMYEAKNDRKTSYRFYTTGKMDRLKEEIIIQNDLRKAIEQQNLRVHYQPRVDSQTEKVVGFEGLARWEHPQEGFIAPGEFIPVAESSGLIVPLENRIAQRVSKDLSNELELRERKISLNLSSQHLLKEDLDIWFDKLLSEYPVDPNQVEVEITETSLIPHIDYTVEVLKTLRSKGFHIAVDDFGTGYSSLEYLTALPIDTVKIDYSFVNGVPEDDFSQELIKMISLVAENLDLTVVAEGVETEEEFDFMKDYSDEIQGFLFSPPKAPSDLEVVLEKAGV